MAVLQNVVGEMTRRTHTRCSSSPDPFTKGKSFDQFGECSHRRSRSSSVRIGRFECFDETCNQCEGEEGATSQRRPTSRKFGRFLLEDEGLEVKDEYDDIVVTSPGFDSESAIRFLSYRRGRFEIEEINTVRSSPNRSVRSSPHRCARSSPGQSVRSSRSRPVHLRSYSEPIQFLTKDLFVNNSSSPVSVSLSQTLDVPNYPKDLDKRGGHPCVRAPRSPSSQTQLGRFCVIKI
eukprot:976985_1